MNTRRARSVAMPMSAVLLFSRCAIHRGLLLWLLTCLAVCGCSRTDGPSVRSDLIGTVASLQAVHPAVTLLTADGKERNVMGLTRVGAGDRVATNEHGRARVELDDGTLLVLDESTQVSLTATLEIERGRVFVQSPPNAQTKIALRRVSTVVTGASVSVHNLPSDTSVYCVNGELVLVSGGTQTRVESGETARVGETTVEVVPEVAFDDWTGGLAVPWENEVGSRSAIAELRGASGDADLGTPLVTRSHEVKVTISGEIARTKSLTTYFNGGAASRRMRAQLALPNGAILTRVARHTPATIEANVAISDGASVVDHADFQGLEWSGDGYLSGDVGPIEAGQVVALELEYVEWLSRGESSAQARAYRYPMRSSPGWPPVGALHIELDVTHEGGRWVSANLGAQIDPKQPTRLTYRLSDVRPTADFVAEYVHETPYSVRAYVHGELPSLDSDLKPGDAPYVLLRADLPEQANTGITLALVVDTSMSAAATFETSRAVVDTLLSSLSPEDEVVVFTADQEVRPLGSPRPVPLTPNVRSELQRGLSTLQLGGASNLGRALHRAADALDAPDRGDDAGSGLVVYIGDGRPTMGLSDVSDLRRELLRRENGSPRLTAVAVGPNADKWALARLTSGSGEVYEALDRSDAAQVGAKLFSDALQPTWRDVELELGASFDRIYPRNPRAVIHGGTVTVFGRLRGELPETVALSYRKGTSATTEALRLERVRPPTYADISQRWALARVEDIAGSENAIEPAIALAHEAKLLTPWTGWFFSGPADGKGARRFADRVLTLSSRNDAPYGSYVEPVLAPGTMLLDAQPNTRQRPSLKQAAEFAIRRVLRRAGARVQACRRSRLAAKPDLALSFAVTVAVDGEGRTTRVSVTSSDAGRRDISVERCIEGVIRGLPQIATGTTVNLTHLFTLSESDVQQPTRCSEVSHISLPLRRSIWRSREATAPGYIEAAGQCELPRWRDKRAYLDLMLDANRAALTHLESAVTLADAGHADAAQYLRQEALRRVSSFDELQTIPMVLLDDEPNLPREFAQLYARAKTDAQRLDVVRRYLPLAPHDVVLRKRLLYLLESLGHHAELASTIRAIREEPLVDAGLLAAGASALGRLGHNEEGARGFGELLERAPGDPWTLAFVGDRLRAERQFDESVVVYEQLARLVPDDAGIGLRLAVAHAGAGRLDVATRLLQSVAATGGREENGRLGDLAAIVQSALLAAELGRTTPPNAELMRRLQQTPLPDVASVVVAVSPPSDNPVKLRLNPEDKGESSLAPTFDASPLGIQAALIERGATRVKLHLGRDSDADPVYAGSTLLYVITPQPDGTPTLQQREVTVDNEHEVTLDLSGGKLL